MKSRYHYLQWHLQSWLSKRVYINLFKLKLEILRNFSTSFGKYFLRTSFSVDIIDNGNIGHGFLGIHGLHLNEHGVGKLALNFVKRIRSIRNSGSAKQKLKEVHSKISSF